MLWLWILLVITALLAVLCLTRVGVWVSYDAEGTLRLDARIGFLRVHILPAKPKKAKPKEPKKPKKPKKEKKKPQKPGKERQKLSFTLEDGEDALRTMLPPLKRALKRVGRGIRIKPLRLSLTLGGMENPASAAVNCGKLQAAVWTGMPVLERLLDIRDPYIHTDVDFNARTPAVEAEAGAAFRIGTLLAVGFGLAFPALRWFLRFRKRCKNRPSKPEKKGKKPKTPPEEGAVLNEAVNTNKEA